jgi:signal transduction histidine kinase
LSGAVEPPEALKNPHYALMGTVDQAGCYGLVLRLRGPDSEEHIAGQFAFRDGHTPQCGPFKIELRVWDRDPASMDEMAHEYGSTIADVRGDLNRAAGINIYRDGFRVLPYGEPRNDWLRLDLRRVQNPTMRLSNNQIVGYVLISADENPGLRDQSNREGLFEGPAMDDLRALVESVLSELETRRYKARPREEKATAHPGGLFAGFELAAVREAVEKRHPRDTRLLALVVEREEDLQRRVREVQEVLARYRRLATLGQLIDTVLHEARSPLAKIRHEAQLGLQDMEDAVRDSARLIQRLGQRYGIIDMESGVLAAVFRKIEPFGGRKRGRPAQVPLEEVIADAFSVLDAEIAEVGARMVLPQTATLATVDQAEIQEVIINLLQNSLYWLRKVKNGPREVAVQVHRNGPDEVEIIFSDSGPGVESEFRERIFDPYFSTKPDGVGLGLTIAGEIVSEYYAGELELLDRGPLPGATFRVILRRRV